MSTTDDFIMEMEYIDGITIIDDSGKILFTVKFNPIFNPEAKEKEGVIGKTLYEAFTNLDDSSSTLIKSMMLGKPIKRKRQDIIDLHGKKIKTMNLSMPIKAGNKTIGAIEISKDITKITKGYDDSIKIDFSIFENMKNVDSMSANRAKYDLDDIISKNKEIKEIKYQIQKLHDSCVPVFIYGETGTGKELFAHAIHNSSNRKNKPFVPINCAAIPEGLLESILFGTVEGSFTGAVDTPGLFEVAQGGTLYLDEINSMDINLQAKLLRVLEDGYVRRVGGKKEKQVDVRIISSSNVDVGTCIKQEMLRQDIYYRLCVMNITIPPLRERKEDIVLMLNYFINQYNMLLNKNITKVSKEVYDYFMYYDWPGNVRELKHIIEYVMNIIDKDENTIEMHHLESKIKEIELMSGDVSIDSDYTIKPLKPQIERIERIEIYKALKKTKGNVSQAARFLQIPRQTLQNKINRYNIEIED